MTAPDDHNNTSRRHFDPGLERTTVLAATGATTANDADAITERHGVVDSGDHSAPIERTDEYPVVASPTASTDGERFEQRLEQHLDGRNDPASGSGELAASVILPGFATVRRSVLVGASLVALGVLAPIALFAWIVIERSRIVGLALDPTFLLIVMAVGLLAVLTRVVAISEVAFAHRRSSGIEMRTVVALLMTAAISAPALYVVSEAAAARSAVSDVFNSDSGDPLYVPESGALTATGVLVDPAAVTNVLIIGGDAGPGRWGMRTDTMMLVTIHDESGRMALTSIPRNLTGLTFPPGSPLAAEFPNGFDDLTNALFTHVNSDPQLTAHYGRTGLQPEAMALVEALGYSLNVEIDDFALVNMQGFTEVIDAVGGVTLELGQSVPLPPSLPGERALPTEIGPGLVEMDGAMAIAYARSRSADSDYQRMGRQRQLLAALGTQISATAAAGAFATVTGVLDDSMRTSLSAGEFDRLLDQLGDNAAIRESVGLAPPLVTPGSPDYEQISMIVAGVQQSLIDDVPSGYAG